MFPLSPFIPIVLKKLYNYSYTQINITHTIPPPSDKPSKPKGPLKVSDVTADSVKLKWDPPEDDGGEPVDHYVVERMDTETGRWVPVTESKVGTCLSLPCFYVQVSSCVLDRYIFLFCFLYYSVMSYFLYWFCSCCILF